MPTLSAQQLTEFATTLLTAGALSADEARLVATSLVGANLRGHDSHGVMRIPFYLDQCSKNEIVPGAELVVIRESDSVLATDGQWGFGQTQAQRLTQRLVDKAKRAGTAVGTLIRSS